MHLLTKLPEFFETNKSALWLVFILIGEMIRTEEEYVASLEHILNNYIPLMESDDLAAVLKGRKNVLFGNVKRIYEFHKR